MATIVTTKKACTVNPLKMSQPIGAALAFMGLNNAMPLLHGSQGCTAFGLVLFVRHFREAIPLQTTAMNEVATVLGGMENLEQALVNIHKRARPAIIGVCSTGVTEIKGDDLDGHLKLIRARHPELDDMAVVCVSTPDFSGAFQDGWARCVTNVINALVPESDAAGKISNQVNVLAGCHLTPADLEEIREIIESFGMSPVILPDLYGSLDGHIPGDFSPTTLGGTTLDQIRSMGLSRYTIAVGEQMRSAAQRLEDRTRVPFALFERLTGLESNDKFISFLAELSGRSVPAKYRRQRSQLVDAMLDGHFFFGRKKIAIGAEPDLLWSLGAWLAELGCEIRAAVTTTSSPLLEKFPASEVLIGDLEDLEMQAKGCDLLITHSHGRQMAERLSIPLLRAGLPMFDRLGAAHRLSVGYRGTRDLIFEIGNMFIEHIPDHHIDTWTETERDHACTQATACSG